MKKLLKKKAAFKKLPGCFTAAGFYKGDIVMNMNIDVVNRALYATGQEMLDITRGSSKDSSVYKLCKAFYLATLLEALSEVEWVGGRKRIKLEFTGKNVLKNRKYNYVYDMPYDCARPIELQDNEYFIVEDRFIMTDVPDAELLYVSNGKAASPIVDVSENLLTGYIFAGRPGTTPDCTLDPGKIADLPYVKNGTWWVDQNDTGISSLDAAPGIKDNAGPVTDYPDFTELNYEPKFFEYIEKKLAAKFAMKLSEKPELYTMLMKEALLVKQEAIDASRASRAAKVKENNWWGKELGLV